MARTPRRDDLIIVKELRIQNKLDLKGTEVTALAGELNALDGVTSTVTELNKLDGFTGTYKDLNVLDGAPFGATFVIGAEGGDVINVGIQLVDADAVALAIRGSVQAYMSDDAAGDSIAAAAASANVAIGTDGLCMHLITDKLFQLTSESDGDIDLNIGEAGAATWYLILIMPNGKLVASGAITFA